MSLTMLIISVVRESNATYTLEHLARAIRDVDLATSLVSPLALNIWLLYSGVD